MRACVTTGEKGKMECREIPEPALKPGTLKLKTRCALICGSDLEYLEGEHGEVAPNEVRGHEFVADVIEVGEGVEGWKVGDRAVPISYTSNYGCWADVFVCPPIGVQKVPEHVSDEEAVFVEPLHTGVGAVEACGLELGKSVVVVGTGKIGLLTIMAAKLAGAAPIIAVDIAKSRLDKALEVGADYAFNSSEVDVVAEVKRINKGPGHPALDGPDAIILCARQGKVLSDALKMCKQGSHIVLAGFIPPTEIDPSELVKKQIVMSGILSGRFGEHRNNGERALYALTHRRIDPRPLLSGTLPFEDIQNAIDSTRRGEHLAVLLKP